MIETVRLSQDQRNKLLKIRKATSIRNWNVICRWALCCSLSSPDDPPPYVRGGKTGIEMDWTTFTGRELQVVYDAILGKTGVEGFYAHLHRGIEELSEVTSLGALLTKVSAKTKPSR